MSARALPRSVLAASLGPIVLATVALAGCAGTGAEAEPETPVDATEALKQRCIALLRDQRRWCGEARTLEGTSSTGRCLRARLDLQTECF